MTLTCSSNSTTVPQGFEITYSWMVDNNSISDSRYMTLGLNNQQLLINPVRRTDHDRKFQCSARENVFNSPNSSTENVKINVLCKSNRS